MQIRPFQEKAEAKLPSPAIMRPIFEGLASILVIGKSVGTAKSNTYDIPDHADCIYVLE